jgi:Zn ribbon nucleic-acid-binding protein
MSKCPNCGNENAKPKKMWKYGQLDVQFFICSNCGTEYRDYVKEGKHSFKLKKQKGKGLIKA